MKARIAVLPGDGIGEEITVEAVKVMKAIAERFGHNFEFNYAPIGAQAIDSHNDPFPEESQRVCEASDAILLGAVGDPRFDDPKLPVRPEQGLLKVRKVFDLYANLRPVKFFPGIAGASPIKDELVEGVDMVVVRELTGGLYFGKPSEVRQTANGREGVDTMFYTEKEIERIVRLGFEMARGRRKLLTSVDKANVLSSSRLWRDVATEVAKEYPDVEFETMLVDSCAMRLVRQPKHFDVVVTENTFGDILTDEASVIAGSMGMLPSASLGEVVGTEKKASGVRFGLYEPIHGSAPKYKGLNVTNPIATILSGAMLLRYSLALNDEANAIEDAVAGVLADGYRTYDIVAPGQDKTSTSDMGSLIAKKVIAMA